MNDTKADPAPDMAAHQRDLHTVFQWLVQSYRQGAALQGAAESLMLDPHRMASLGTNTCYSMARGMTWNFKWMDVQWFAREVEEDRDHRYPFVAIDYHNKLKVGTTLIAGVLVTDPDLRANADTPSSWAHWAVNTTSRDQGSSSGVQLFGRQELTSGIEEYTPLPGTSLPKFAQGTVKVTSGSLPIAWLETRERLSEVLTALCTLYEPGDHGPLAGLCEAARRDCEPREGEPGGG